MRRKKLLSLLQFDTSGLATLFAWAIALALVTWGYRVYTVHSVVSLAGLPMPRPGTFWRGMVSDAAIALLWSIISVHLLRLPVLKCLSVLLWCFLLTGNMTNITVNGANLSVYSFNDGLQKDFILGTVITASIIVPTLIGFISFVALHIPIKAFLGRFSTRTLTELAAAHVFIVVLLMVLPVKVVKPWVFFNVVEDNVRNVYFFPQPRLMQVGNPILSKFVYRDLEGRKIVPQPSGKRPNILMIVIEGLSANMMASGWTPNLARRVHEGIYYTNFVNPSRRTANGMYSLLCGDYPLLVIRGHNRNFFTTSKGADVFTSGQQRYCLPRMLSTLNYRTVYMQPTDLAFERQGSLNSLIGFHEQYGKPAYAFEDYVPNDWWGPNDPSMFRITEKKINQLQQAGKPWFLTTLTVGTHHPWAVPFPYNVYDLPPAKRAFMFMDYALDKFLSNLEESGVTKNTLIMITSDESAAPTNPNLNSPKSVLPENQGFMLILTPEKHKEIMPEVFAQPDVFLSIADYIGADTSHIPFGRSMFRHYDSFRPIIMGSVFSHHLMGMLEPKKFMMCHSLVLKSCRQFAMNSNDLFHTKFRREATTKGSALFFQSVSMRIQNTLFPRHYPFPKPTVKAAAHH